MMVRTQISVEAEHLARAKAKAAELGLSLAAYFRRILIRDLDEKPAKVDVSVVFGLGSSGRTDISANKGRYIAEAIAADKIERRTKL